MMASIQVLRAIAALLVVFFHLSPGRLTFGAAGVDIFFVISGFIMTTFATEDPPGVFLVRRAIRIVPLYWLVTAAMCVGAEVSVFRNFSYDWVSLLKSLTFIPYYNSDGEIWPLVVVGWTLNFEAFFYVCFAIALATRAPKFTLVAIILAMVGLGLVLKPANPILVAWTSPLLLEFAAGCAIAHFRMRVSQTSGMFFVVAGFAALVASNFLPIDLNAYRLLVWGVPAVVVVFGAISLEETLQGNFATFRALRSIGDWSYSLYLTHGVVVAAVHRFLGDGIWQAGVILAAAIFLSRLSYVIVERGVSKRLKSLVEKRRPASRVLH